MKALVLGARGAVGVATVAALRADGHAVATAGRRGDVDVVLDLQAADASARLAQAARGQDVVVNASGVESRALAGLSALVEVSASAAYLRDLWAASPGGARAVWGAGLAPGLSTLLVAALETEPGDEVDVAVTLGAGEAHGPAAVAWTAGLVGREVVSAPAGERAVNLRERRRLPGRAGRPATFLRADFPDHDLIGVERGVAVRAYVAVDVPWLTWAMRAAAYVPGGGRMVAAAPHLGGTAWSVSATHRRTGQALGVQGSGQSAATGVLAALAATRLVESGVPGMGSMASVAGWEEAVAALRRHDASVEHWQRR
ncbi:hypothetical protein [Demequina litorisediminis]|uniref:Saccharopine dehydrogenase n=1 Tax=Demequina litorisediminis TaxID=1849022 RepID=A0ABQ6IH53_9MICO|nr:hypothetical protein [Demequina litorisediminis]GMA37194.1 hypothetical protein GCM10025876_33980 [Demequina litorisediminis]